MEILFQFSVALGLGLLVGLQREKSEESLAGIRTFALITLFGALTAHLSKTQGPWILASGLIGLTALVVSGNVAKLKLDKIDPGITTEVAVLAMYVLGALVVIGPVFVAVVLGATVAVLLHLKAPMHRLVSAIGEQDIRALMRFVVITLIILPVLPREHFGPYGFFHPFETWLMVTLVVGISLLGYVLYKVFGSSKASLANGILGGLISSTATTVSFVRQSEKYKTQTTRLALVIVLATTISYLRVLLELVAVNRQNVATLCLPVTLLFLVGLILSAIVWSKEKNTQVKEGISIPNPAEMKTALLFGFLYVLVTFLVSFARHKLGPTGVYLISFLSGLTDLDAITLSTARLVDRSIISSTVGWRSLVLASLGNLLFKFTLVYFLGTRSLSIYVGASFGILFVTGTLVLFFVS